MAFFYLGASSPTCGARSGGAVSDLPGVAGLFLFAAASRGGAHPSVRDGPCESGPEGEERMGGTTSAHRRPTGGSSGSSRTLLAHTGYGDCSRRASTSGAQRPTFFSKSTGSDISCRARMPHALNIDPTCPSSPAGLPSCFRRASSLRRSLPRGSSSCRNGPSRGSASSGSSSTSFDETPSFPVSTWRTTASSTSHPGGSSWPWRRGRISCGEWGAWRVTRGRRRPGHRSRRARPCPEHGVPQRGRPVGGHGAEIPRKGEAMEQPWYAYQQVGRFQDANRRIWALRRIPGTRSPGNLRERRRDRISPITKPFARERAVPGPSRRFTPIIPAAK